VGILRKLWWGQYPLGAAFWGFYVGGLLAILLLSTLAFHIANEYQLGALVFAASLIVFWGYGLIATVGVWNSAALRIKSTIWMERVPGYLARFVVFIYAAKIIWGLMNGGALNLMNLIAR
jgi:hypothetical protein